MTQAEEDLISAIKQIILDNIVLPDPQDDYGEDIKSMLTRIAQLEDELDELKYSQNNPDPEPDEVPDVTSPTPGVDFKTVINTPWSDTKKLSGANSVLIDLGKQKTNDLILENCSNITIRNVMTDGKYIPIKIKGACSNIIIENCDFYKGSKFVFVDYTKGATVNGLIIRKCHGTNFSKHFADVSPGSSNIEIYDCTVDAAYNDKENFVMGFIARGNVAGIDIHDCVFKNFIYAWYQRDNENHYWNGDGITIEKGCTDVKITNVVIERATDAGIDTKSEIKITDVVVKSCKRGLRFWNKTGNILNGVELIDCNKDAIENYVRAAGVQGPYRPPYGAAGIWKRYDDVKIEGLGTVKFTNTSSTIRVN